MKNRNLFFGLLLILLGLLWFLDNLNILNFQWTYFFNAIFDLWPLILIAIGINLLIKNKIVERIIRILFFLILVGYSFFLQWNAPINTPENIYKNQAYAIDLRQETTKGKVDLDIGGMSFDITSGTSKFVDLSGARSLEYKVNNKSSIQSVAISNPDVINYFHGDFPDHSFELKINESIPWNFNIDAGAVDGNLNLQNIALEELDLDMGAGKVEIYLGEKSINSNINIDAGASQIILHISNESGIKVNFEGGLNHTNFSEIGLIEQGENTYVSGNYREASSRYNINADMGLGDFKIHYYVE